MTSIAVRDIPLANDRGDRFLSRGGGGSFSGTGVKRVGPGAQTTMTADQVEGFGQQERGSGTDGVADVRRRSPVTDPNELPRFITPENTLNRQRLGFDVREATPDLSGIEGAISRLQASSQGGGGGFDPSSGFLDFLRSQVRGDLEGGLNREELIRRQFESQLPFLNEQFSDQAQDIANRTAALGRTGSGQVDRQFAELENQQELKRRGLLGQLTSQAAAQAIQDRLGLMGQGRGIAGVQAQRDIGAGEIASRNRQANIQGMSNALQGALGGARLGLQGQRMNQQRDLEQSRFLERQRNFENQLARQAVQDQGNRLRLLQQGFASNPIDQLQREASTGILGAGEFGTNAAGASAGLGGAMQQLMESGAFGGGGGGGGASTLIDLFSGQSAGPTITQSPNVPSPGGPLNDGSLPSPRQVPLPKGVNLGGLL